MNFVDFSPFGDHIKRTVQQFRQSVIDGMTFRRTGFKPQKYVDASVSQMSFKEFRVPLDDEGKQYDYNYAFGEMHHSLCKLKQEDRDKFREELLKEFADLDKSDNDFKYALDIFCDMEAYRSRIIKLMTPYKKLIPKKVKKVVVEQSDSE
jgi:hypothetical protein